MSLLPRRLFLDACVLYPTQTRDLFMALALERWVWLYWTDRVQEEWLTNLLANRPDLTPEQVERLRKTPEAMRTTLAFQEPLVTGYEHLVESVSLPDENDRHVVAAAYLGEAEAILTFNLDDFPEEALAPWDLQAVHPDKYLLDLAEAQIRVHSFPKPLLELLRKQRSRLTRPPLDPDEFLQALEKAGLQGFAQLLRSFRSHL